MNVVYKCKKNCEVIYVIKINGQLCNMDGKTIAEYLSETDYDIRRIAVEKNGDIVPKSQYSGTLLNDGDIVEVVSFVGGG